MSEEQLAAAEVKKTESLERKARERAERNEKKEREKKKKLEDRERWKKTRDGEFRTTRFFDEKGNLVESKRVEADLFLPFLSIYVPSEKRKREREERNALAAASGSSYVPPSPEGGGDDSFFADESFAQSRAGSEDVIYLQDQDME